jgi:hypothetical protein
MALRVRGCQTVVSNTTSGTYNFTPNAGQCASAVASLSVTVNPSVTPTFTPIPAFCSGTAAPTLPSTSNNGIAGTWSPTVVSNTTSGTYAFTPNAGQCATTASLSVTVNPSVTPTFTQSLLFVVERHRTYFAEYIKQWHCGYMVADYR